MTQYAFDKAPGATNHPPWVTSQNATYATAREGGTLSLTTNAYARVGQDLGYYCYQTLLDFDTSSLPDDEDIVSAFLTFRVQAFYLSESFVMELRAYDFGGTREKEDFRPGSQLDNYTLLGSIDMATVLASKGSGNANVYTWQIPVDPAALNVINKSGSTRLILVSREQRLGNAPTANQYVTLYSSNMPQLIVRTKGKSYGGVRHQWQTSSTTLTLQMPRPLAVGDLLLVHHVANKGSTTWHSAGMAGWTCLQFYSDANQSAYVAARLATADDLAVSATTFPIDGFDGGLSNVASRAAVSVWSGLSQSAPVFASSKHGTNPASATVTADAITPKKANEWLLFLVSAQRVASGTPTVSGYAVANDNPATWTEEYDVGDLLCGTLSLALAEYAGAGSTGAGTATLSQSLINQGFLIALAPSGPSWTDVSVSINAGAASTDDNDVTLTLHAAADDAAPTSMRFSEDGETWTDWESYATTRAYQLSPQTSYPTQAKTVYAQFRLTDGSDTFDSDVVSDAIDLEVEWTSAVVIVNRDAEQTYDPDVTVRFRAYSSAHESAYTDYPKLVRRFRIRDSEGAWGEWQTAVLDLYSDWATTSLSFDGSGDRLAEVMWEDSDGNQWTATDAIYVVPPGVMLDNVPPPQEVTNWRLVIGGRDFIDDLDGPPAFTRGEHGPGELHGDLPIDDPMHPYANELVAGAKVDLWDGTYHLWEGTLKPLAPVSSDTPALALVAAGPLDSAKQDESVYWSVVDADPANWHVSETASKAYSLTTEGRIRIKHEKGRGVEANSGAGIWYWANMGKKAQVIDHLEFGDSDIDVGGSGWYARVQVSTSPWGAWTTVREWNNTTASGFVRVPPNAGQSFAEAGYANVYAVKVIMFSDADLTAAESVNNRWIDLVDPQVFFVESELRVDELQAAVATLLGYPTETEAIGSAVESAAWFAEPTTWAAILDDIAGRHSLPVEWRWHDGTFVSRQRPSAPEYRHRWYTVDTRYCDWGIVTDDEDRKDYVQVIYLTKSDAVYPNGTTRTLYRPSAPTDVFARVGVLDMTKEGPMTAAAASNAGDQWLTWNADASHSGSVSGFGGYLRTVDGQWVAACHAREGDWIQARDLLDCPPLYITGVDVQDVDQVTIFVGGAESEFRYRALIFHRPPNIRPTVPPARKP